METPIRAIFMVEIRISKDTHNRDIIKEAYVAQTYCQAASEWNADHGGKLWIYALLSHDEVRINSSFDFLMSIRVLEEQLALSDI